MGKQKDQEGSRIYGMFSICHLQMLEDWHLIKIRVQRKSFLQLAIRRS